MNTNWTLALSDPRSTLENVGGKAASLARMLEAGLPVPDGFSVTTDAYRYFVSSSGIQEGILEDLRMIDAAVPSSLEEASRSIQKRFLTAPVPAEIARAVSASYRALPNECPVVAVRSSATAEDLPGASFAGQQETYLNLRGEDAVLVAVRRAWASLWTARAISYRVRQNIAPESVALAAVVQLLVFADAAGILFTANPVTGQRDQILVNAAWGLGEAIVGGLVTPDTFTLEKTSGREIAREIADKERMTVREASGTTEQPVPEELRRAPSLDAEALSELARLGREIEQLYEMPMDVEWALVDGKVAILQARPVTALPDEPSQGTAAAETAQLVPELEWRLPDPKGHYARGSIVDFMPDPLTPLFESLIVPSVNGSIRRIMGRFSKKELGMYQNYLTTINNFAYMPIGFSARQWLEMLVYMGPAFPRILREGVPIWRDEMQPRYEAASLRWETADLSGLASGELLKAAVDLMTIVTDHLASLQVGTLGSAASAEGLFTAVYNKFIKRAGDPSAPTFVMGFESIPIRAEMALFDLAGWAAGQPALAAYLRKHSAAAIARQSRAGEVPQDVDTQVWQAWVERFETYLNQFGYSIYNLDFARPLPLDDPEPLIEMVKLYLAGMGQNPYERQRAAAERRQKAEQAVEPRLKGIKGWAYRKTLKWAQTYGPLREDSIAEIGRGYPALRRLFGELGQRMAAAGIVTAPADIYWLHVREVEQAAAALDRGAPGQDYRMQVAERHQRWQSLKRVNPPTQLPKKLKILGKDLEAMMGVHADQDGGAVITGLGASPGEATGTARVLHGPEDFDQMRPGDVLVAAITTPAWTPLFGMAAAVVTDIGGPLSHGSIVAREYGIPAVLGTTVATHRIRSGDRVTVDGTNGTVTIID